MEDSKVRVLRIAPGVTCHVCVARHRTVTCHGAGTCHGGRLPWRTGAPLRTRQLSHLASNATRAKPRENAWCIRLHGASPAL